jgi:L-2-hydroxycarboxylate dehydrogenase (NAD+)
MADHVTRSAEDLKAFCVRALCRAGVDEADARITADVLVAADLRGVASHGVAHLRRYVYGLRDGTMVARPQERVVTETPATAVLDAGGGLGPPVSCRAMQVAIEKAAAVGAGFVTVRNSNHFGIAGYYAMLALPHDCIGLALTNASTKAVPTFGRDAVLGTNPVAVAAPAGRERPFVLDMATTTATLGKVEIAERLGEPLLAGWAIDGNGRPAVDAHRALQDLLRNAGGGLLPLGGAGEELSGHKGYGLAVGVEVFTALLSGAAFATLTYPRTPEGRPLPADLGHFFGAWRIDAFRPPDEFRAAMDELQGLLKNAPKAAGQERIYIAGEKEQEALERNRVEGIPLSPQVAGDLDALARELGLGGW